MSDNINHPKHYETGKYECIEVMREALGEDAVKAFCLCNAFKYIYRCMSKHETPIEDVKKAAWYLNKYIELSGATSWYIRQVQNAFAKGENNAEG